MIRYLRHKEIDCNKWDRCIAQSVNGLVYACSWYLDIVSPGWEALEQDDYRSVFPLTGASKMGIHYLRQPFFTQQLGLFSTGLLSKESVAEFLNAIPAKYRLAEIHLNAFNRVDPAQFDTVVRRNHELELVQPYEILAARYSQNTQRNIRKAAAAGVTVKRKVDPDDLIRLFRDNFGKKEGKLSYKDYLTITRLITHSLRNSSGIIMGAAAEEGSLDAAAFFLMDKSRYIFLFSASDFATRDNGAMFLLVDTFIREHSNRPLILDFEGGHDPGLGRFYKGFGAAETGYPMVRINRLPPLMDTGRALLKKIRGK
jgi:hypothetical protein